MTTKYERLQTLISALRPYTTRKSLMKAPISLYKEYILFKAFLGETDGRLTPQTQVRRFKRYKKTALAFKSESLGIDLSKNSAFDSFDRYSSSSKIIAKVTDGMVKTGTQLKSIETQTKRIHVGYKKTSMKKVVIFSLQDPSDRPLSFMSTLSPKLYINIGDTAYNKNALDFVDDYLNQSDDFAENLEPALIEEHVYIYTQ